MNDAIKTEWTSFFKTGGPSSAVEWEEYNIDDEKTMFISQSGLSNVKLELLDGLEMSKALHFNTFGGNPLACAVGMEVLNVIEDEGLQANCVHTGEYFIQQMKKLQDKYEFLGDVRGKDRG